VAGLGQNQQAMPKIATGWLDLSWQPFLPACDYGVIMVTGNIVQLIAVGGHKPLQHLTCSGCSAIMVVTCANHPFSSSLLASFAFHSL
jgi:hypothetical protein